MKAAASNEGNATADAVAERRRSMGILARAPLAEVEGAVRDAGALPHYRLLRAAETGLVMIRGRIGGNGAPFNLGEMTVTRCAVSLDTGAIGHGYVAGRAVRHAELAAVLDAAFQDDARGGALRRRILAPLIAAAERRRGKRAAETADTRVEFFTVVRGED